MNWRFWSKIFLPKASKNHQNGVNRKIWSHCYLDLSRIGAIKATNKASHFSSEAELFNSLYLISNSVIRSSYGKLNGLVFNCAILLRHNSKSFLKGRLSKTFHMHVCLHHNDLTCMLLLYIWPAFWCCAQQTLVEICFFNMSCAKKLKWEKKKRKLRQNLEKKMFRVCTFSTYLFG